MVQLLGKLRQEKHLGQECESSLGNISRYFLFKKKGHRGVPF
jgi:hypothetical protein